MIPQEKAKEMYDKYEKIFVDANADSWGKEAKQCALLTVVEILKYQPYDVYTIDQCNNVNKYWGQVKEEIEKL